MSDTPLSDSIPPPTSPAAAESVSIPTPQPVSPAPTAGLEGAPAGGEVPPSGETPDGFNKKKRARHRGGRGRSKKFPAGEGGADDEADDEADDNDEEVLQGEAAASVEGGEEAPEGGTSSAAPSVSPTPAARREPREMRDPRREPREPREAREPREPREPRLGDRGPRPDPRVARHERVDPRGHQGARPERFERPERVDRTPLDTRELSEKAWQLFFGELREEGLALIDETDAEKLSNRCFKLAEIFMRQRQRRINQLASTGTTLQDDRRHAGPPEARAPLPPRPKPEIPIERRLPDDPAKLSKEEAEALIEEAQEIAEQKAEAAAADPPPEGAAPVAPEEPEPEEPVATPGAAPAAEISEENPPPAAP